MDHTCQCGAALLPWRLRPDRGVGRDTKHPHVWAADKVDAVRAWGWTGGTPAHDVLTGGPAAEIMAFGACRVSTAP